MSSTIIEPVVRFRVLEYFIKTIVTNPKSKQSYINRSKTNSYPLKLLKQKVCSADGIPMTKVVGDICNKFFVTVYCFSISSARLLHDPYFGQC